MTLCFYEFYLCVCVCETCVCVSHEFLFYLGLPVCVVLFLLFFLSVCCLKKEKEILELNGWEGGEGSGKRQGKENTLGKNNLPIKK